jgi:hypothetical protein
MRMNERWIAERISLLYPTDWREHDEWTDLDLLL